MLMRQLALSHYEPRWSDRLRRSNVLTVLTLHKGLSALAAAVLAGLLLALATLNHADLSQLSPVQVEGMRITAKMGLDQTALESLRLSARQGNVDAMRAVGGLLIGSDDYA